MSQPAGRQRLHTAILVALTFFTQSVSLGPDRVSIPLKKAPDRPNPKYRASTYATRIPATLRAGGKSAQQVPSQVIRFSRRQSPAQFSSPQPATSAGPSWSLQQAKALARLRWQSGKRLKAQARSENGTVRSLIGWRLQRSATMPQPGRSLLETTAIQCLERNLELFNIDHPSREWQLIDSHTDPLNHTQVSFAQVYGGLEVWPSSLTVQLNRQGHVNEVSAAYVPTPTAVETTPSVTDSQARRIANHFLQPPHLPSTTSPEIVGTQLLIHAPLTHTPQLAYSVHAHHASGLDWSIFVDAHTGTILSAHNHVCAAAVKGVGTDTLGASQDLNLWFEEDAFAMVDTTKSMYQPTRSDPPGLKTTFGGIFVYDANNVSPAQKILPYTPGLIRSATANSGFGPDAVSASVNLSRIYDYYELRHQRQSIDGMGGNIIGVVNIPMANAYWQDGIISLGNVGPYAHALDVVSHELTHGVIEHTADLIFRDQSGALSEAFSDIFGEAAEAFHNQGKPDWIVGTLLKTPLRDISNPGRIEIVPGKPYPSRMSEFIPPSDPFLDTLPGRDNGGVHLNSTIISHAFYQLAEGLSEPIGLLAAERIFYRALTTKLQKQAQFVDCRIACIRSAEELFGAGSNEAQQTALAFSKVEIFDQIPLPEPEPVPVIEGSDLVLFTYTNPEDGQTYLGRADPSQALDEDNISVLDLPIAPNSRPAVSRDGSVAIVVTADLNVAIVDPIAEVAEVVLDPGSTWSVGLSPDGRYVGIVLADDSEPLNTINVIDIASDDTESYEIKAPTRSGTGTDTVEFVDSITFTADGQAIYCDGLNSVTFSDGDVFGSWNIYSVDRRNQTVVSVFPNSSGGNFANPSLGRAFVDHLLYETEDQETGNSLIYIKDLTTGGQVGIGESSAIEGLAFPDFAGDDRAVIYSDYPADGSLGGLFRQPLANDGLSPIGDPSMWFPTDQSGAIIGAVFRRGSYEGLNVIEVSAASERLTEGDGIAHFSLQRIGSTTEPLTVQFVTTGSAIPGRDYLPIPLFATFPSGESRLQIPVRILDDALSEPTKTLSFSLVPKLSYILGESDIVEVAIIDNDENDSLQGYNLWAREREVRSPSEDPDGDRRPNLVEYAIGSDPSTFDEMPVLSSRLLTIGEETYLVATVMRRMKRVDVTYGFELSEDLRNWQPADEQLILVEDSDRQLIVRQSNPVGNAKQTYLRLSLALNRPPQTSSPSLATGFSGAQLFSTFGAVKRFDEPDHCGIPGGHPFWFSYQAPRKGRVTMTTDGSDFDTILAVYRTPDNDFTQLQEVACDNDSGLDNADSALAFNAEANEIYFVVVDGVNGASGFVSLSYNMDLELSLRIVRPTLASPGGSQEEPFGFVVEAEPGIPFTIETSDDMILWNPLTTAAADETGEYAFRDPDFSTTRIPRFFRVYYSPSP